MIEVQNSSQALMAGEAADSAQDDALSPTDLQFRDFRLIPAARILLKGRTPVAIGSRAFDILHALLQARGRIVAKQDIVRSAWPTTIVEESNLRFQVAQLRKVLGDDQDLIKTIPGRGYLFALECDPGNSLQVPQEIQIVGHHGVKDVASVTTPRVQRVTDDGPQSAAHRTCAEARKLLQRFLDTLEIENGQAVILYVRFAE